MLNTLISDVLKDDKPDEKFVMYICLTKRIDPDHKGGSILEYAITHHHDSLMKLILYHHSHQLSPIIFNFTIQKLFLNKSYKERDYKLLIHLDKVKVSENFKRQAFNKILTQ